MSGFESDDYVGESDLSNGIIVHPKKDCKGKEKVMESSEP